jgi:hypothetical protein
MFKFTRTTAVFKCDYCGGGAESADLSYVKQIAANHIDCNPDYNPTLPMFTYYGHDYHVEEV